MAQKVMIINAGIDGYENEVSELNDILEEGYTIKKHEVYSDQIFMFILEQED